jgi:hypothetical protein
MAALSRVLLLEQGFVTSRPNHGLAGLCLTTPAGHWPVCRYLPCVQLDSYDPGQQGRKLWMLSLKGKTLWTFGLTLSPSTDVLVCSSRSSIFALHALRRGRVTGMSSGLRGLQPYITVRSFAP